jgi:hypothetical protein
MSETTTTQERSTAEEAKARAQDVASSASGKAGEVVDQAKEQASQVASAAGEQVGEVLGTARQELRDRAQQEAGNLGQRLNEVAEELRSMSQASSGGVATNLVSTLADQADRGARRLNEGDLTTVVADVKRYARNNPGVFLVGALGAGFVVGRLLRAADLQQVGQTAKDAVSGANEEQPAMSSGNGNGSSTPTPAIPEVATSRPTPTAQTASGAPAPGGSSGVTS